MARVILIAGIGGAGATSLARATGEAIIQERMTLRAIDATDPSRPIDDTVSGLLAATLGRMAVQAGADALLPQEWGSLPSIRLAGVLREMRAEAREADVVVVDAGSLLSLRDLLALPHALLRFLDAALTPRAAMVRSVADEDSLFDSLSAARIEVLAWLALLASPECSVRLVGPAQGDAVPHLERAVAVTAFLGVRVDGVVLNRFPRKKDGLPARVRRDAKRVLSEMQAQLPGIAVWRSATRLRSSPKGMPTHSDLSDLELPAGPHAGTVADDAAGGYTWDIALGGIASDEVCVGRQGSSLVLQYDGLHRWLDLPPVLQRCQPVDVEDRQGGVRIRWTPDPDRWPRGGH